MQHDQKDLTDCTRYLVSSHFHWHSLRGETGKVEDRGWPLRHHEGPNPEDNHFITSNKRRRPIDNGSDTCKAAVRHTALSFPILSCSVSTHG
jgi:hypothetical protein